MSMSPLTTTREAIRMKEGVQPGQLYELGSEIMKEHPGQKRGESVNPQITRGMLK